MEKGLRVFDAHVHIFPPEMFKKIWRYFLIHYWYVVYQWSEEKLAKFLEERTCGYTTLVYAHRPGLAKFLNAYVLNFARKHPRAVSVGTFHPEDEDLYEYVEEALSQGMKGFKIHPEVQNFDPAHPRLKDVYRMMNEAGAVLHIHSAKTPIPCRWTGVENFRRLLKLAPELKIVVAHGALPEFRAYYEFSRDHPIYFDLAMVGMDYPGIWKVDEFFLEKVREEPEKFLFGTDFPNIPYEWKRQIEVVYKWGLSAEALERIFWRNAEKLYGLHLRV